MQTKKTIKELVVVEGKTDSAKLKKLFNVETIETKGLSLSKKTIYDIKTLSKNKGLILFLDPDGPGEKIRKKLNEFFPKTKNCFIEKSDILEKSKKFGLAEATDESIIKAFNNIVTFDLGNNSISWDEYINLDLSSFKKRKDLCSLLNISYCNNKQLFKRLNMLNYSYREVLNLIKKIN